MVREATSKMSTKPRKPLAEHNQRPQNTFDPVRAAATQVIGLVLDKGQKTDEAIERVAGKSNFDELDSRFLRQLCHGVVKMKRRLDFTCSFYLKKPDFQLDKTVQNILRLGFYQLLFTDRIPASAAVSESVNLARNLVSPGHASFVNAVLRNYLRHPEQVVFPDKTVAVEKYLALFYSYPDWFVEYCCGQFGPEQTERLLACGNKTPQITYRVNKLRASCESVASSFDEHKIAYHAGKYLTDFYHLDRAGLPLEKQLITTGMVYVQDEAAGLAVKLLDPQSGENILDLAAAPGGKAAFAAALMDNKGSVTALDTNRKRLQVLAENASRLGVKIINPVHCDLLDFTGPVADRVLLDAPCSGWGVMRRHSDLRWSKTAADSAKLSDIQLKLLRHAADLVKPGGVLVYSTCTIVSQENDEVIRRFLSERADFTVEPASLWVDKELVDTHGAVKTYPAGDDMDGAFCVRIKKGFGS